MRSINAFASLALLAGALALLPGCGKDQPPGDWAGIAATLPTEITAAKKEGIPLEPADIKGPSVSADKNAATYYRRAIAEFEKASADARGSLLADMEKELRDRSAPMSIVSPTIRKHYADAKALLVKGAKYEVCDFERDWTQGADLMFPEYAQLKALVKLMTTEAVLQARKGQTVSALSGLRTCAKVAEDCGEDPTLIGMLVRIANDAIALRGMEIIASEQAGNARTLTALRSTLKEFGADPDLMHSVRAEIVMGRYMIRGIDSFDKLEALSNGMEAGPSTGSTPPADTKRPITNEMQKAFEARLIAYWRQVYAHRRANPKEDPAKLAAALDELTAHGEKYRGDATYLMNAIMMPVYTQAGEAIVTRNARLALMKAKLDLLLYRKQRGSFPDALSKIGKYTDPFTGKELVYRRTGEGFVVYSIGRDRKDDGGFAGTAGAPKDVVVEHPLSPTKLPRAR